MATVPTSDQDKLPDSDFAYVAPGGTHDKAGFTEPRSKRHLLIKDAEHVHDAEARFDQTEFDSAAAKRTAWDKIKAAAKRTGAKIDSELGDDGKLHPKAAAHSLATYALSINDADPGVQGVPAWVMLVPSGTFKGRDGRGPFHIANPDDVIAETQAQQLEAGLPFDINHSTDFAAPKGGESPAAGWIKELANRDGAIWGRVEWTALGKESLTRGPNNEPPQYRYISPVFTFDEKTGEVQEILRAALTNNPNLYDTVICARAIEMKVNIAAKITEMAAAKPELKIAARKLFLAAHLSGELDLIKLATQAKKGTPIEEAYGLLKGQADAAGISIAHFIDALVDMAKGQSESPDKIDDDDMPPETQDADEETLAPLDAKAGDLSDDAGDSSGDDDEAMAANEKLAEECRAAAEKVKTPQIAARLHQLRAEALERCSKMKTKAAKVATHAAAPDSDDDMDDAQMADCMERMADEHEKAGRSEDAKLARKVAAKHRAKHEESAREEHRKMAAEEAKQAANAATEALRGTLSTVTKQVTELQGRSIADRARTAVETHIREGRLAPAQREWAIGYCTADEVAYGAFIAKQPVLKPGADGTFTEIKPADGDALTPAELHIARVVGASPKAFAAMRKESLNGRPLVGVRE